MHRVRHSGQAFEVVHLVEETTATCHFPEVLGFIHNERTRLKTLLYRQPRAFIVDEAQHFRKMASGRRLLDQMDNLKSLAGMTNTVHVLVGRSEERRVGEE